MTDRHQASAILEADTQTPACHRIHPTLLPGALSAQWSAEPTESPEQSTTETVRPRRDDQRLALSMLLLCRPFHQEILGGHTAETREWRQKEPRVDPVREEFLPEYIERAKRVPEVSRIYTREGEFGTELICILDADSYRDDVLTALLTIEYHLGRSSRQRPSDTMYIWRCGHPYDQIVGRHWRQEFARD